MKILALTLLAALTLAGCKQEDRFRAASAASTHRLGDGPLLRHERIGAHGP